MSQKTVAQLHAEIASQLPTNNANQITAADVRGVLDDMVDSSGNLSDGTPATLYSADGTLSGARTVEASGNALQIQNYSSVTFDSDSTSVANISAQLIATDQTVVANVQSNIDTKFANFFSTFWASSMSARGAAGGIQSIRVDGDPGSITLTAPINNIGGSGQAVGFMGASATVRTADANQAVATDPTSVITLANALRQEMITRGFWKGSA